MTVEQNSKPDAESLKIAYQEACNWYHRIDDFRAKLLGALPLVSGAGIFLLLNDSVVTGTIDKNYLFAIGIFGCVITLGLLFYELRGVQRCIRITNVIRDLEKSMGIIGPFRLWPHSYRGFVNEPVAAGIIYPSVLAAWIYVAMQINESNQIRWIVSVGIFMVAFISILWIFYHHFRYDLKYKQDREKELQSTVPHAVVKSK